MKGFRPEQVINGTWGEVWFDGEYLAQVTACKAEVTLKKTANFTMPKFGRRSESNRVRAKGRIEVTQNQQFCNE